MSVKSSIDDTTESIISALSSHNLSDAERQKITEIVGQLLVKTVKKTTKDHLKTATHCCGPERDLAHQIQEEMISKRDMLISNLKAMR